MAEVCERCGIEFEPKTPKTVRSQQPELIHWHVGCMAAQAFANTHRDKCHHAIIAEDGSYYAFMHRKYGCPDEGVPWPKASKELGFE